MPWTASEMQAKGADRPGLAARVANDQLARCLKAKRERKGQVTDADRKACEAIAIRSGLAVSNRTSRR